MGVYSTGRQMHKYNDVEKCRLSLNVSLHPRPQPRLAGVGTCSKGEVRGGSEVAWFCKTEPQPQQQLNQYN